MNDKLEISYAPRSPKGARPKIDEDDLSGASLGRYLLLRKLGRGGMGVVYEAEDNLLNRRVAVKLLPQTSKPGARMIERFFVEAQVAARLNHPNIIGIFDIGERNGTFFIVMELLNELSLGSYLRKRGALHWQEATRIAADCCAALHDAHLVGLVHRDIKPDNILCAPSGLIKVADFGLVKELAHTSADGGQLTQENAIVGSPQYMSPEQCRSELVDSRCDIYSLGATYYSMLTGRPPYDSGVPMILMMHHCSSPIPDPRVLVPDLPQTCVDILELAMQKNPDERFHTAEEMRAALETLLAGAAKVPFTFAVPANSTQQAARQRRSEELLAALVDENNDGQTIEVPIQVVSDLIEESVDDSEETAAAKSPAKSPSPDKSSARSPTRSSARSPELESSDTRRMALLEAALAMAPTAPIRRATKAQVWRWRYGRAVFAGMAVLTLLVLTILIHQFAPLLIDEPAAQATVRSTIKVGIVQSLSGPMSPMGRPVADATLLAIDELNEQGGLLGSSIEAVVVDGKSEAETFAAAAERLVNRDKVQVLFGGLHADSRRGLRQVVENYNQLLLYPGDSEGLEESPNVFYLGGVPSQRITPALRYCVEKLGYKRFFLLGADMYSARAQSALLHDGITKLGGKVVGERLVSRGSPDFAGVIKKIASAEPELVISTLRGDANVYFFRAWQQRDKRLLELPVLSLALDENILTLLDGTDLSQNYVAGSYFEAVARPQNAAFIARFRKKYGVHRVITEAMEAAYSSVYLWAQAVRTAGDFNVQKVRLALTTQTFQGPSALYRFDAAYAWKTFYLAHIAPGNKLELIDSSPGLIRPQLYPGSRTRAQWDALYGRM